MPGSLFVGDDSGEEESDWLLELVCSGDIDV